MTRSGVVRPLSLLGAAAIVVGWAVAFRVGLALGHVTVALAIFAVVASALVGPSLLAGARSLVVIRASDLAIGFGAGAASLVVTHAAWPWVATAVPQWREEMTQLLTALGAPPSWWTPVLVAVVAVLEELLFRGAALDAVSRRETSRERVFVVVTALYAAAQLGAASGLLLVAAIGLGALWTGLRLWRKNLLPGVLAHLVWTLGVLFVFPVQA